MKSIPAATPITLTKEEHAELEGLARGGNKLVDQIKKEPGVPLPDVDALNAAIPQTEWEQDFNGNPKGPWVRTYVVFLLDPATGAKIACSNSTTGQRIAFESLKERVEYMRAIRGERVVPMVELSSKPMKTKFGVKLRPDFKILEWRILGGPATGNVLPGSAVAKLTASAIVKDSLPWDDPIPNNI